MSRTTRRKRRLTRRQAEEAAYLEAEQVEYSCGETPTDRANGQGASALTTLALSDVPWVAHAYRDAPAPANSTGV